MNDRTSRQTFTQRDDERRSVMCQRRRIKVKLSLNLVYLHWGSIGKASNILQQRAQDWINNWNNFRSCYRP